MTPSRRQFLEDSLFAAVAALAGGTRCSWAEPATKQEAVGNSPLDRLGIAVIGLRGRGGSHLAAFSRCPNTEILYVCDPDAVVAACRAEQVERRQNRQPTIAEDLRKVLDDPRVDVVSIATPNHWHALAAIWAMQAGKDVYVEKPVSHNVSEGRLMVQAARKYGRICQAGTQCRSNPANREAMAFLHAGELGAVRLARGLCYKRRRAIGARGRYEVPPAVDYDLWLGPAPPAPLTRPKLHYDWNWQWPYGNGELGNQGVHQMDLARWGLGLNRLSDRVLSYGGRFGYRDAADTPNTQVVVHDFGEQALIFEVRGLPSDDLRGAKVGVLFEGTGGYLVTNSYTQAAAFDLQGNLIRSFRGGGDFLHYANFVQAVRSRNAAELNADIEEGHLSSALCHLGNISYRVGAETDVTEAQRRIAAAPRRRQMQETLQRTLRHLQENDLPAKQFRLHLGEPLQLDAASETIVDQAPAAHLLTREYRPPFVVPQGHNI
jgi:predicted dehydrogenase